MLKGKEISLRHVRASELDQLIELINNSELKGEYARSLLKSPASLKKEFELNSFSTENSEMFVIVNQENNILGVISHFLTSHYSSARELGFSVFTQENQKKGIATKAVNILTKYLFENYSINRIQICMPTEHKASEKVAIKCGYTKEGMLRGSIFVRGQFLNTYIYSILRSEYERTI